MNRWVAVRGDLTRPESLTTALAGVSVVVHGAAYIGEDWDRSQEVNVDGTWALAQATLAAGAERFVDISTMSVYGEPLPGDYLFEESSSSRAPAGLDTNRPTGCVGLSPPSL